MISGFDGSVNPAAVMALRQDRDDAATSSDAPRRRLSRTGRRGGVEGAEQVDLGPGTAVLFAALTWYGVEAALAVVAGWPLDRWTPLAWITRDLLLPWLWVKGWTGDNFEWRGNAMTVGEDNLATGEGK